MRKKNCYLQPEVLYILYVFYFRDEGDSHSEPGCELEDVVRGSSRFQDLHSSSLQLKNTCAHEKKIHNLRRDCGLEGVVDDLFLEDCQLDSVVKRQTLWASREECPWKTSVANHPIAPSPNLSGRTPPEKYHLRTTPQRKNTKHQILHAYWQRRKKFSAAEHQINSFHTCALPASGSGQCAEAMP